jgi:hypothetical protein
VDIGGGVRFVSESFETVGGCCHKTDSPPHIFHLFEKAPPLSLSLSPPPAPCYQRMFGGGVMRGSRKKGATALLRILHAHVFLCLFVLCFCPMKIGRYYERNNLFSETKIDFRNKNRLQKQKSIFRNKNRLLTCESSWKEPMMKEIYTPFIFEYYDDLFTTKT